MFELVSKIKSFVLDKNFLEFNIVHVDHSRFNLLVIDNSAKLKCRYLLFFKWNFLIFFFYKFLETYEEAT